LGYARSPDSQLVDALDRLAAASAKQGTAVAAKQGIGSGLGAIRAVKLGGGGLRVGHVAIIAPLEAPRVNQRRGTQIKKN
jgi:hypothetical protein